MIVTLPDGTKYYDHKLTQIEKGELLDTIALSNKTTPSGLSSVSSIGTQNKANPAVESGERNLSGPLSNVKDKRLLSILQINTNEEAAKIKLATGWERGADGKWRYEEADSLLDDAQINRMKDGASRLLGNILGKDNALFDSYPQLRDYWLTFMEDEDMRGDWGNISETSININDSLTNDEINRLSFTRFNTPFKELRALPLAETTEETGTMITLQERLRPGMFLYEEI